mmetsp:Transcript_39714/g.45238  ORF Transcript_39714/g.45238 Transcript_39714/m.45238 type:complete len:122 (-) Transcript_39714:193-558(-)
MPLTPKREMSWRDLSPMVKSTRRCRQAGSASTVSCNLQSQSIPKHNSTRKLFIADASVFEKKFKVSSISPKRMTSPTKYSKSQHGSCNRDARRRQLMEANKLLELISTDLFASTGTVNKLG